MEFKIQKKPNKFEQTCFNCYDEIRASSKYNMITEADEAMKAAKLTEDEYWFVVENYDVLKQRYGES